MRKIALGGVSAFALVLAASSAGLAADISVYDPSPTPAAAAPEFDWSGFYFGAHVGMAGTRMRFQTNNEGCPASCESFSRSVTSGLLGGQLGWNWQSGPYVWGLEADVSWTGLNGSATRSTDWCCSSRKANIDTLASIRGRLGFAFDRGLVYGTGGVGYVHGQGQQFESPLASVEISNWGPVAGAGVAYALTPNIIGRLEGLGYFINQTTNLEPPGGSSTEGVQIQNVWTVRVGLDFKL